MTTPSITASPLPVTGIALSRPLVWLKRGWDDLRHNPGASLTYGLLVSVLGAVMLAFWNHPYFMVASISGFLLIGPLLATGLVELSRRRDIGDDTGFDDSLSALGRHRDALIKLSLGLVVISAVWFAASTVMLWAALGSATPVLGSTIWGGLMDRLSMTQLLSYIAVGGVLACIVFARSVVSIPMILDRDADATTAVQTSHKVTMADLPAMLVWAALIVGLVAFGFATYLVGMILVFPLLSHATWHAYKDVVE